MNKRKLLLVALSLCMVAILAMGGTLAYLTDTDSETNTFTVGNVQIDLVENFTQKSKLLPGIDVTKEVKITNVGTEDAYVWYTYAIPAALNNDNDASKNILHVNHFGRTWDDYRENKKYWVEGQDAALPLEQTWDIDWKQIGNDTPIDDTGILYDVYVCLYHGVVKAAYTDAAGNEVPAEATTLAMSKVYLDTKVDFDGTDYTYDGEKITHTVNDATVPFNMIDDIQIVIQAYGIQAAGINDVYEAYKLFQEQFNN